MNKLIKTILDKIPRGFFTVQELIQILPGSNNMRYGLIKRALSKGDLIQVKRGLYCLAPVYQKEAIHPYVFSQLIHGPSYISLESALAWHGWIPEAVYAITNVSLKQSKEFHTPFGLFSYTRIPQNILYAGVELVALGTGTAVFMALPLKALLDYLYIHKKKWKSLTDVELDLRIDRLQFQKINKTMLRKLRENYRSRKIREFLDDLMKELF